MVCASSLSENELQRANNNGLSRTCFTGHHIEAGGETQLEAIDEKQVPDTEFMKHVAGVCQAKGRNESRQIAKRPCLHVKKRRMY